MTVRGDGRLPLTIVGGFLGAGKSTWLRHQLREGAFARHHVLINEAAETPVDNLLFGRAWRLDTLAAGCACCEGRKTLVTALRGICGEVAQSGVDGIVLETSGLADPAAIAAAVAADPILARRLVIARTITLVDAVSGALQLAAEPLARAQAEAADAFVITKVAAAGPNALARLAATLRAVNPGAAITAAERGETAPLPDQPAPPWDLPPLAAVTPIRPHRVRVGDAGGWAALSTWLSALLFARGDDVVRVKGVVETPAGLLLLQSVRHLVQPPEILPAHGVGLAGPPPEVGVVVLIGRDIDPAALALSWDRFGG